MFHDKKIVKSKNLRELWKSAHNLVDKCPTRNRVPKACDEISSLLDFGDVTVRQRLSLRSAAILLNGAARINKMHSEQLLKDVCYLDKTMRSRKRPRQETTETVPESSTIVEYREKSPIISVAKRKIPAPLQPTAVEHTRTPRRDDTFQSPTQSDKSIQRAIEDLRPIHDDSARANGKRSLERPRFSSKSARRTETPGSNERSPRRPLHDTIECPSLSDIHTLPGSGRKTTESSNESEHHLSRTIRHCKDTLDTMQETFDKILPFASVAVYDSYEARIPVYTFYTSLNTDVIRTAPL